MWEACYCVYADSESEILAQGPLTHIYVPRVLGSWITAVWEDEGWTGVVLEDEKRWTGAVWRDKTGWTRAVWGDEGWTEAGKRTRTSPMLWSCRASVRR